MKKITLAALTALALICAGCTMESRTTVWHQPGTTLPGETTKTRHWGAVTPPADAAVDVSVSTIGVSISQNQATQTPEAVIGWKRARYTRISPVATNQTLPTVRSKLNMHQSGFTTVIEEGFSTGKAAVDEESRPIPLSSTNSLQASVTNGVKDVLKTKLRETLGQ
jgi:hypothetical protein